MRLLRGSSEFRVRASDDCIIVLSRVCLAAPCKPTVLHRCATSGFTLVASCHRTAFNNVHAYPLGVPYKPRNPLFESQPPCPMTQSSNAGGEHFLPKPQNHTESAKPHAGRSGWSPRTRRNGWWPVGRFSRPGCRGERLVGADALATSRCLETEFPSFRVQATQRRSLSFYVKGLLESCF